MQKFSRKQNKTCKTEKKKKEKKKTTKGLMHEMVQFLMGISKTVNRK